MKTVTREFLKLAHNALMKAYCHEIENDGKVDNESETAKRIERVLKEVGELTRNL